MEMDIIDIRCMGTQRF